MAMKVTMKAATTHRNRGRWLDWHCPGHAAPEAHACIAAQHGRGSGSGSTRSRMEPCLERAVPDLGRTVAMQRRHHAVTAHPNDRRANCGRHRHQPSTASRGCGSLWSCVPPVENLFAAAVRSSGHPRRSEWRDMFGRFSYTAPIAAQKSTAGRRVFIVRGFVYQRSVRGSKPL